MAVDFYLYLLLAITMNCRKALLSLVAIILITAGIIYWYVRREPETIYSPTDNSRLIKIRRQLTVLKQELRDKGRYNCCIRNDCNWCALYMGHCPCADLVRREGRERSCPECAAAWNKKQGRVPGIDPRVIEVTTFGVYGFENDEHQHHH